MSYISMSTYIHSYILNYKTNTATQYKMTQPYCTQNTTCV